MVLFISLSLARFLHFFTLLFFYPESSILCVWKATKELEVLNGVRSSREIWLLEESWLGSLPSQIHGLSQFEAKFFTPYSYSMHSHQKFKLIPLTNSTHSQNLRRAFSFWAAKRNEKCPPGISPKNFKV